MKRIPRTDQTTVLDGFAIKSGNARIYGPQENGGAIDCDGGTPTLRNLRLVGNHASTFGGAINLDGNGPQVVENCLFVANTNDRYGGGLFCGNPQAVLRNLHFYANSAQLGGAVSMPAGILRDSRLYANSATVGGGAIHANSYGPGATFENLLIVGNSGPNGGAFRFITAITPKISNLTVVGNIASVSGGAYWADSNVQPSFLNCIFWNNEAPSSPQLLSPNLGSSGYNLIEGGSVSHPTITAVDADPLFVRNPDSGGDWSNGVNNDYGDLSLRPGSPAINQGTEIVGFSSPLADYAGNPRESGFGWDIGAYEFQQMFESYFPGLTKGGDENDNGLTNFEEYNRGLDPTAPNSPSLNAPRFGGLNLVFKTREGVEDSVDNWEFSETLKEDSWRDLIEGVDFTIISSNASEGVLTREIQLIDPPPTFFMRQTW